MTGPQSSVTEAKNPWGEVRRFLVLQGALASGAECQSQSSTNEEET